MKTAVDARVLRYALLLGQGRSGTNYLLQLLNQSPHTHCRNEADQLRESGLARLAPWRFFADEHDFPALEEVWDGAMREAALCMGPRDHVVAHDKDWLRPGMRRIGYAYLRNRYRAVHALLRRGPPMFGRESRFPFWLSSSARLERAFHVFKLNAAVGLATFLFRRRPAAKAIHIVRHPGGFTRSWQKRWVESADRQASERVAKERLLEIARRDPTFARHFGDPAPLSYIEAELWFWRWCNERIRADGAGTSSYFGLTYEELAADPAQVARRILEACELPWSEELRGRMLAFSGEAGRIAEAWKDSLDKGTVELIERVLDTSPLARSWAA
jgi:hypothetical protein